MPPRLSPTPGYTTNIELYGDEDSAGLTPRTPFSRQTANAEEGRSRRLRSTIPVNAPIAEDDGDIDEIDLLQTQSHPLLASSDSALFPLRSRGRSTGRSKIGPWQRLKHRLSSAVKHRLPLGLIVGSIAAFLLLLLLGLAFRRPEILQDYLGVNTTAIAFDSLDEESKARFNTSTVIDYAAAGFTEFPLATNQYMHQCLKFTNDPRMKLWVPYWGTRPGAELDVLHKKPTPSSKTCSSSITYLLDGSVGLMADLAFLAQVAWFARERNRTLLVYDKAWNRGRWTDHFLPFSETQPGPEPGCAPPPPEELVACPRTARHWVISARIAYYHMGKDFVEEFEDAYKYNIDRQKPIFEHAAESFSAAIWPSTTNQKLIERTRSEISELIDPNADRSDGGYIATHIRRGDRIAQSWRYLHLPNKQVPVSEYVDAVWKTYKRLPSAPAMASPLVYLASDSPSAAAEFTNLLTTDDSLLQIHGNETNKPSVYTLRESTDPELRDIAPAMEYVQAEWGGRSEEERIKETRGVIVDWALMTGAWTPEPENAMGASGSEVKPAAVICTLPSNLCKVAAVGFGWDRAFAIEGVDPGPDQRWVEIDNGGSIVPIWKPFELV